MAEQVVVADAGPILHLHWVGASDWALPGGPIIVVETVWLEIGHHAPAALADLRLQRVPDPQIMPAALAGYDLDPGERAAIAYAILERPSEPVQMLSDDKGARRACSELALLYTGSVGLILEAHASGVVSYVAAAAALKALPVSGGLWLHPKLLSAAHSALQAQR